MARSNTTWQQGESGNPLGRPKQKESISELLRMKLFENGERERNVDVVVSKLITLATSGNLQAIKLILERIDGSIKVSSSEEYLRSLLI